MFQAFVHKSVMEELKRIIDDSEVMHEDDALWPPPDRVGRQVGQTFRIICLFVCCIPTQIFRLDW